MSIYRRRRLHPAWRYIRIYRRPGGAARLEFKFVVSSDSALLEFVLGRRSLPDCLPFRSQKSIGFFTSPNLRSQNVANSK